MLEYKTNELTNILQSGSGRTPYSRFGDGYAVYRSSIREFLGSEGTTIFTASHI
jgi:uncharacterized protein YdiU (UPF0061 family)